MSGVGTGLGRGLQNEGATLDQQVRALHALRAVNPDHPAVVAVEAAPAAVAAAARDAGVTAIDLQQAAAEVVGGRLASRLSAADCVRHVGAGRVAAMARVRPETLLQAANVAPVAAVASGLATIRPVADARRAPITVRRAAMLRHAVPTISTALARAQIGEVALTPEKTATELGEKATSSKAGLGADGWPAIPGFRPGNWDGGRPTPGKPRYMIASGDTLSGLAKLYLGGPQRWNEIWNAGDNKSRFAGPDKIPAGKWIAMPKEALDGAIALMGDPAQERAPATPGAPGSQPGATDPAEEEPGTGAPWSTKKKLVVAGGAAAALVGGYLLLR